MKVKIVSDGTVRGTNVVNAETGEEIKYVTSVEWRISAEHDEPFTEAIITVANVQLELTGEAALQIAPAFAALEALEKE